MPRKKTYTLQEAGRKLGISRSAVYEAIRSGRLKAHYTVIRLRSWAIDALDLRAYEVSAPHQSAGKKTAHRLTVKHLVTILQSYYTQPA
ncbi:MAG: helix-turn-helix domain-containing protein [Nitrospirae bacterium]|nr:helix-turn-helix domain-containing protein [Nitrospirota bacterium]